MSVAFHHKKLHRNTFAQALRSEGIPVSTGFPRLMNENPFTKGDLRETPIAKDINEHKYLGFFQIGYPNTIEDMQDIVEAFQKISTKLDELEKINAHFAYKREYTLGR